MEAGDKSRYVAVLVTGVGFIMLTNERVGSVNSSLFNIFPGLSAFERPFLEHPCENLSLNGTFVSWRPPEVSFHVFDDLGEGGGVLVLVM